MTNIPTLPTEILKELEEAFYDVPFENSAYQNKVFVLAAQHTPARAYRALGLRMLSKINAIKELKYKRQLEEVEIDELNEVITDSISTSFAKRRAQIEIDYKLDGHNYSNKLLNDAVTELDLLYLEFKKYPKYTREQFEAEEVEHFTKHLMFQNQTQHKDAVGSLILMENETKFELAVQEQLRLKNGL